MFVAENFPDATIWQAPRELPDLRRINIIALDTETNDGGLRGSWLSVAMARWVYLRDQRCLA